MRGNLCVYIESSQTNQFQMLPRNQNGTLWYRFFTFYGIVAHCIVIYRQEILKKNNTTFMRILFKAGSEIFSAYAGAML